MPDAEDVREELEVEAVEHSDGKGSRPQGISFAPYEHGTAGNSGRKGRTPNENGLPTGDQHDIGRSDGAAQRSHGRHICLAPRLRDCPPVAVEERKVPSEWHPEAFTLRMRVR